MKSGLRKARNGIGVILLIAVILVFWERRPVPPSQSVTLAAIPVILPSAREMPTGLPLRAYAASCHLTIGTAVDADALRDEPAYRQTLAREFDSVTPENAMKFRDLSVAPGQYDFTDADAIVDFAEANQMQVRGHTLVWNQGLPDWLENGNLPNETLATIFERHIRTVVGRYGDQVPVWDVVNEAVDYDGSLRDGFWLSALGKDYIERAFQIAHEAAPQAKLFYSDYGGEGLGTKSL